MSVATLTLPTTVRAAIYVRISSDSEGQGLGVERQAELCRDLAKRHGWQVADVYEDNDLSAFSGKARPAYRRLLDDMRAGTVNAVVAWHTDRLTRRDRELLDFIDLVNQTGCGVETVQTGDLNLSTYDGRMVAKILGNIAMRESEHRSARLKAKHAQLAKAGGDGGGGRAFGYEDDRRTIRNNEADLIRDAAKRVLAGEPLRRIASDWNQRGVKSVKGGAWSVKVLRGVLIGARISGRRERGTDAKGVRHFPGEIIATAQWPAIITVEQSDRLRALLSDPSRRQGQHAKKYLLTGGLAVCKLDGARLMARPKQNWRKGQPSIPSLVCSANPGHIRIASGPLETLVVEKVLLAVDGGALARALRGTGVDRKATTELVAVEQKLADLAEDWATDRLTRGEWETARRALVGRQDALRRRVETSRRSVGLDGLPDPLREAWPGLELYRQRAIVMALIEKVEIGRGVPGLNKFDKRRVSIRWKA